MLLVVSLPANCELKLITLLSLSDCQGHLLGDEQDFMENETRTAIAVLFDLAFMIGEHI